MFTADYILDSFTPGYPLERIAPVDDVLFLDIETTGFTAKSSNLYLIGCACYEDGRFHVHQWMAEKYDEEAAVLDAFFTFAASYHYLIHYNGNAFDIPYLQQKAASLSLPYHFDGFDGLDIYKRIAPYKHFLKLSNCKQKTIEAFLGIGREDKYSGGELISIYHDYVKEPIEDFRDLLLLHNKEDIIGMLKVLPILAYHDLFNGEVNAKKVQANYYTDYSGNRRQELLMTLSLPTPLPVPVSLSVDSCYFKGEDDTATLKVPLIEEELKYFYANYKDYYYLPEEDVALHKSVADFVDKEFRVQATAATCYTRKYSLYLQQWDIIFEPFFKREYKSKELFFELTDEIKKDRKAFTTYARHVLDMMSSVY